MSAAFSGVSRCAEPSRCERKCAPSSSIVQPLGEAEDLVAAAVGQDRTPPADEPVQAAAARDQVVAGPQIEMIGVAEQDLGAEPLEIAVRDALDRALRADGHERRRLDLAVRRRQHAGARASIGVVDLKRKRHMLSLVVGFIA